MWLYVLGVPVILLVSSFLIIRLISKKDTRLIADHRFNTPDFWPIEKRDLLGRILIPYMDELIRRPYVQELYSVGRTYSSNVDDIIRVLQKLSSYVRQPENMILLGNKVLQVYPVCDRVVTELTYPNHVLSVLRYYRAFIWKTVAAVNGTYKERYGESLPNDAYFSYHNDQIRSILLYLLSANNEDPDQEIEILDGGNQTLITILYQYVLDVSQ